MFFEVGIQCEFKHESSISKFKVVLFFQSVSKRFFVRKRFIRK